MENPEKRPTVRYLSDGRHVPTTKGLKRTGEERETIKKSKLGKPRPVEHVLQRSTVWTIVRPLLLRGAINREISEITGIDYKRVKWATDKSKRVWFKVQKDMCESPSTAEKRRKAALIRKKRRENGGLREDEKKSLEFAKRLIDHGMVADDLSYWKRMVFAYQSKGRNLPVEFSDRLRLEVFLQTISKARSGDHSLLSEYQQIGAEIGYAWFDNSLAEEEDFIAKFEDEELGKISEDKLGYYREDEKGRWRYPVAFGENGGIIFDSSRAALTRELARSNRVGE